eukprot:2361077-Pyramimonas_sp.AAC.1
MYLWDNDHKYLSSDLSIDDMYGSQNDASSSKYLFIPPPYNSKCPEPTPIQDVEFSAVSMFQDVYQAGAPAGESDGSWIQVQSADVT